MLSRSCIGIDGNVGLGQQLRPLRGRARLEDARKLAIDDVDVGGAAGESREFRILAQIVAAGRLEEALPLLVVIDDHAEIAVAGLVGPAVARQMPRVAALVQRRLVGEPAHVVAHDEARHGLEHGNVERAGRARCARDARGWRRPRRPRSGRRCDRPARSARSAECRRRSAPSAPAIRSRPGSDRHRRASPHKARPGRSRTRRHRSGADCACATTS